MKHSANIQSVLRSTTIAAVALLLTASCNNSQKTDNSETMMDKKEANQQAYSETDLNFLKDVTEINQTEILLGQLAQEKTTRTDVKELGKMMEDSHTKCQNSLKDLTDKKSISLMAVSTDNAMAAHKKLSEKTGRDFDKDYCDRMVKGHKEAIVKFEKASTNCKDEDVRAFASATLPELHKHLDHAEMCLEKCEKMK